MCVYVCMCVHVYIYIYVRVCVCVQNVCCVADRTLDLITLTAVSGVVLVILVTLLVWAVLKSRRHVGHDEDTVSSVDTEDLDAVEASVESGAEPVELQVINPKSGKGSGSGSGSLSSVATEEEGATTSTAH